MGTRKRLFADWVRDNGIEFSKLYPVPSFRLIAFFRKSLAGGLWSGLRDRDGSFSLLRRSCRKAHPWSCPPHIDPDQSLCSVKIQRPAGSASACCIAEQRRHFPWTGGRSVRRPQSADPWTCS